MSHDEQFSSLQKQIKAMWFWGPIIGGFFTLLITVVTVVNKATTTYDTKVAKKEDITPLAAKIDAVSKQVYDLNLNFQVYKEANKHHIDSVIATNNNRNYGYSYRRYINGKLKTIYIK